MCLPKTSTLAGRYRAVMPGNHVQNGPDRNAYRNKPGNRVEDLKAGLIVNGNISVHVHHPTTCHVVAPWQSAAVCGDNNTRNWFINEELLDRIPADSICRRCLAILRPTRGLP
jgi:hypothetical protein